MASSDGLATATHSISGNVVTVNLAAVADAQVLSVALINVIKRRNVGTVNIPVGILLGDVNADRFVNSGDAVVTRGLSGATTSATNFRNDVNEDGTINSGDSIIVRGRAGNSLP